jgi:hypothetical protein
LKTLDDLDFVPYDSIAENILYHSIKQSLEQVGIAYSKAVINHICNLKGLSEREILTNCDLFEDAMYRLFGYGAVSIINKVKVTALATAVMEDRSNLTVPEILHPSLTINDVLNEIRRIEALNFVRKMSSYNHIAFLYTKKESLDKVLSVYFGESQSPTAILSEKPSNYANLNLSGSISYSELFSTPCTHLIEEPIKKLQNWLVQLRSKVTTNNSVHTTKFAEDDATWWIRNGHSRSLISLERSIGEDMPDMTSILCAFNVSKLTSAQLGIMKPIIKSHDYVIIEEPSFVVFRSNKPTFRHE